MGPLDDPMADDFFIPNPPLAMDYFAPRENALVDAFLLYLHKNNIGHLLWISRDYHRPPPPPKVLEKKLTIC